MNHMRATRRPRMRLVLVWRASDGGLLDALRRCCPLPNGVRVAMGRGSRTLSGWPRRRKWRAQSVEAQNTN
jgi:hypothetical protein